MISMQPKKRGKYTKKFINHYCVLDLETTGLSWKEDQIIEIGILKIRNNKNEDDNILLFHIDSALDYIVRNNKDEVYLRQGDSSIKLSASQIRSLEYERRERNFESEVLAGTGLEDLDLDIINIYKENIEATDIPTEQVLRARGFLVNNNGELNLTKAGMLLFGKNPSIYLPGARVRVLKFEGVDFQVGMDMNIVKEVGL